MSSPELETLKEIFHSARELQPNERSAYLDRACPSDGKLRREVEALLQSHDSADAFITSPPAQLAAEALQRADEFSDVGKTVGRYQLIERIGSGGMGTVYLARRADQQFDMQVAVKLIKRGMDTESVLHRFQHERQILASLDHPNIARLLDGGTTEDGLPYFVMEHIQGERIDRYAEQRRLSIRERLELFRQVCSAVSYAHQHLVVHRDLKPSNILVTADGIPKLLDFGIAKIVQPNDTAATLATMTAAPIMTPEYASPEQIEGAPATTLSDVYSLGAVLYELLAGRPPHQLQNRSPQEVAKLSTAQIEKPSAVTTRSEDARRLRGDLDNIVRMAMRRESARRYASVEQFSEDIRRHLIGRPVIARPDTFSYRTAKFVRRNRLAITAATLLFLTLVGGIIATTWQAQKARIQEQRARAQQARAERRFNDVRKLANSVLFEYHDAIIALPGSTKVREQLLNGAVTYLDSLATEAHDDPALQRELAAAYERVGDVRGGRRSGSLGDMPGAEDSYRKALQIRETLVALKPDDVQARRELAGAHSDLGICLTETELKAGIEHLEKARALLLTLTREEPSDAGLKKALADTSVFLGDALLEAGDLDGAVEQYRAAISSTEEFVKSQQDQKVQPVQLMVQLRLARALWRQQEDVAAARAENDKALPLAKALIEGEPTQPHYQQGLAAVYAQGAEMWRDSDPATGLEYFRRSAEVLEELLKADPANQVTEQGLMELYIDEAHLLTRLGDNSQALLYYSKSAAHADKLSKGSAEPSVGIRLKAATAGAGAARMRAQSGETDVALGECSRLATQLREIPDDPTNLHFRSYRAEAYRYLGYAYRDIAAASRASVIETRQYISAARDMLRQTMSVFDDIRSRGRLDPGDEVTANLIPEEIAKCDAALVE